MKWEKKKKNLDHFKTNDEMRVCVLIVRIEHIVLFNVNSASAIPIAIDFIAQRSNVVVTVFYLLFYFLFFSISLWLIFIQIQFDMWKKRSKWKKKKECVKVCIGARD